MFTRCFSLKRVLQTRSRFTLDARCSLVYQCMDCIALGILQARTPEWVAFPFSRGSSQPGVEPVSPTLQAILHQLSQQGSSVSVTSEQKCFSEPALKQH